MVSPRSLSSVRRGHTNRHTAQRQDELFTAHTQTPTPRDRTQRNALLFSMTVDMRSDSFATKIHFDRNGRQSSFDAEQRRAGL